MRIEADTDLIETAPGAYEVTGPAVHPNAARRRLTATPVETRLGAAVKVTGPDGGLRSVLADALALDARLRRGEVDHLQYGDRIGAIQGQLAAGLARWGRDVISGEPVRDRIELPAGRHG
jgi:hypothetical protein